MTHVPRAAFSASGDRLFPPCNEEAQTDSSPGQALGQVLWQRHKWWCKGPELAGDQVSSEWTTREAKKAEVS